MERMEISLAFPQHPRACCITETARVFYFNRHELIAMICTKAVPMHASNPNKQRSANAEVSSGLAKTHSIRLLPVSLPYKPREFITLPVSDIPCRVGSVAFSTLPTPPLHSRAKIATRGGKI